jgi:hypothetical protein
MIPQERELEGLSVYFLFVYYNFFLREGISYVIFLGKARRFLFPRKVT